MPLITLGDELLCSHSFGGCHEKRGLFDPFNWYRYRTENGARFLKSFSIFRRSTQEPWRTAPIIQKDETVNMLACIIY